MMDWTIPAFFAASFVGSFLGTRLVRAVARRRGWVATPSSRRWHKKPIALHGGVGFFPPFLLLTLAYVATKIPEQAPLESFGAWFAALPAEIGLVLGMLVGATAMFLCGLWDDVHELSPATKFIYQVGATSIFVSLGGVFAVTGVYAVDLCLTYLWFVGITNAVNLLDNMDGLAGGTGVIASTMVALLVWRCTGGAPLATVVAGMLALSLLAYWLHNKFPASIFMGDSGSLALGFCLAALAMPSPLNDHYCLHAQGPLVRSLTTLLLPVAVLAVPVFDTTFVTLTRIMRFQNVHEGGCDHTSHRLVCLGFSEPQAAGILFALGIVGGVIALVAQRFSEQSLPLFGVFIFLFVCVGIYLNHVTVERRQTVKPPFWMTIIKGLLLKRNIANVLLDTILVITCFWGAYLLRFDFKLEPYLRDALIQALPLVVACSLLGLRLAGTYGGTWRLASVADIPSYGLGVLIGTALSLSMATILSRFGSGYSRSAYITFGFLLFLAVTLSRQSFRMLDSFIKSRTSARRKSEQQSVIIYGAGKGGLILLEETLFNPALQGFLVLGFTDDDPQLVGHKIRGLSVRDKAAWVRELSNPPEIWVSSKGIANARALEFANCFTPAAIVRRQTFLLQEVLR